MSSISLKKETAKLVLTKRNLLTPPAVDVALAIDISGSMQRSYTNGVVQEIVERCLALALQFDLDKKLDVFTFNKDSQYVGSITEEHFDGYVKREILDNSKINKWGGTNYTPVLSAVRSKFFPSGIMGMFKKKSPPMFLMFITDGDNQDHEDFEKILKKLRDDNIYIQMICIGGDDFRYANRIADAEPNVGFCEIVDVSKLTDEQMMEKLISSEFVEWAKKL